MKSSKKAMQSYLFIILIVSFIMTVLITSILSSFFKNDPEQCKLIEYEIKNQCKEKSGVSFTIKNLANKKLDFMVNDKTYQDYKLGPLEDKKVLFGTAETTARITPYITDIQGNIFECEGKTTKISIERLLKC